MRKSKVYIALLHYPMYNKRHDIITTSVTNLDLHDISRAARTYNMEGFFVVHPAESQQQLIKTILGFWQEGYGGQYNPDRKDAFRLFRIASTLEEVVKTIQAETGQEVVTVATDAKQYSNSIAYKDLKNMIYNEERVFLLLFGTGFGMEDGLVRNCEFILKPIMGAGDYNHLSVRSAVSIIIDRLLGEFWFSE